MIYYHFCAYMHVSFCVPTYYGITIYFYMHTVYCKCIMFSDLSNFAQKFAVK
jgi:hypothetical protein